MKIAMRHFLVGTACWLLTIGSAPAQTITAGVKAGVALTGLPNAGQVVDQISQTSSTDIRAKLGVTGGGFVQFAFDDRFSFQPELLLVMKGANLKQAQDAGTVTSRVAYLEFPLLARFAAPVSQDLNTYVLVGPSFAIRAGTSAELDGPDETVDLNIDTAIRSLDFGLAFGGGFERNLFFIEARYTFGLIDIANSTFDHEDSLKNRALAIMVGIRIP